MSVSRKVSLALSGSHLPGWSRRSKRRSSAAWMCEPLEKRRLFATDTWIAASGDWSTGSNWSSGAPPQPGDNVVIDVPGVQLTVTYSAAAVLPLGNLINTEVLDIEGGGATWQGGTWDGSGVVDVGSTLSISGSADKIIKDGLGLENLGTVNLSGTGNIVGQVGASITNEPGAVFNVSSDASITFPTGVGTGIFENGGTFIKSGGGTAPGDFTEIGGPQGFTYENSIDDLANEGYAEPGLCLVQQGTLELGDNQNVALTVGSNYQISAGATLDFNEGSHNIVVFRPAPGGTPNMPPSITGAGTLEVSGGNVQFYGMLAVHEIDVSAGSLLLQQNMQETAGTPQRNTTPTLTPYATTDNLNISGGTFGGNGGGIFPVPAPIIREEEPALVVGTSFIWTGGTLSGSGRLVIDATCTTSTISTIAPKAIDGGPDGGFGLDLLCQTVVTDSGTITMNGGSAIYIHNVGSLWDQGNETFTQGTADDEGGSIWNANIFLKLNGNGTTTFGPGIAFVNDLNPLNFVTPVIPILQYQEAPNLDETFAKLDIRTGTVSMQGTSINRNTYLIHPGSTLSFDAGTHLNETYFTSNDVVNASILGVDGGGTLVFGDCGFNSDLNSLVDVPTVDFGDGTYEFDNTAPGAQLVINGTYNGGTTGVITGNGTIEVKTSFAWNSGEFTGTGNGESSFQIDPGAVVTLLAGDYQTTNDYNVVNNGTIQWATSPGTLTIGGNYTQGANAAFDCVIVAGVPDGLAVSGIVTLAGALNLSVQNLTPINGATYTVVNNQGTLPINGAFAGLPEGTIFTVDGDIFKITYVGGANGNSVILTSIVYPVVTIVTPSVFVRPLTGTAQMDFTVTLSAATNDPVSVNYTTSNGSAIAGTDYTATSGTLTITAGATTGSIVVNIIGTTAIKPSETFTVTLSNPVQATLGTPSSAVGTIVSVNGPPTLSFFSSAFVVDEDAGFATVVVTSSNTAIASSVHYATVDGTALAGVDYTATSGVLTFAVGVSQMSFSVPVVDEKLTSGQKQFTVVLSDPVGDGATLGVSTATVGILDNDGIVPTLSIADATASEPLTGQTTAVFVLSLSGATTSVVSVQYSTANGTATEGKYVAQSGTVTIPAGQTSAQISVVVYSDFTQTTTETFGVNLSNPVNVHLGNTSATGTILSQPVTTVNLSQGHPFRYVDAFSRRAVINLTGPGSGTLTYLGSTQDDAKQIVLSGTTPRSQLSISTAGGLTGITNIIVNGPIGAINAPAVLLIGNLTATGGAGVIRLNSLLGGNTVTVGSGGGIATLNAAFSTVTNATLNSALPIAALRTVSWQDTAGGSGIIAPSITTLVAARSFDANVSLTGNLGRMIVGQNLNNSVVNVAGSIGSVTAGTITGSDIFAGVQPGVTTLPSSAAQFTNAVSAISRLTVTSPRAGAFADTLIAAPVIGSVNLSRVVVTNGGSAFGVAGTSIASVHAMGTDRINLNDSTLVASPFSDFDLKIRLA